MSSSNLTDGMNDPLWRKAEDAASKHDFVGVLSILRELANIGVWQVCSRIGELYETGGGGVDIDFDSSIKWYRKSIFLGDDPRGHLGLGRGYYSGKGVAQNRCLAFEHFQKAFNKGLSEAGVYLGLMYHLGLVVPANQTKARECFQVAALDGYCIAYEYMARIELRSLHLIKAFRLAFKSWALAARTHKADPYDRRLLR